jgi:hypothetical protein
MIHKSQHDETPQIICAVVNMPALDGSHIGNGTKPMLINDEKTSTPHSQIRGPASKARSTQVPSNVKNFLCAFHLTATIGA